MRTARWAPAMIVLALLAGACDTNGDEPAPPKTDHQVASAAAAPQPPVDLADGPLTRVWRTELRDGAGAPPDGPDTTERTRFAFTPGQILAISPRGADAIATRDGKARWHYYEPGREVVTHALTGGVLVLVTQRPPDDVRTVALDAASGKELWRSTTLRPVGMSRPAGQSVVQASGQGVVVLADAKSRYVLFGVDARTGARRWTWPAPGRATPTSTGSEIVTCAIVPYETDGALLLVQRACGWDRQPPLTALDPRTGRRVWQRAFVAAPGARPFGKEGLTLLPEAGDGDDTVRLIGRDGRELYHAESPDGGSGSLLVTGGRAILTYRHALLDWKPGSYRRVGIDLRTGKAGEPVPADPTMTTGVGSRNAYAQLDRLAIGDRSAAQLLPGGLETIDPRTLATERIPLPTTSASSFWTGQISGSLRVLLSDGRVYVATDADHGLQLSGYAPGGPGAPAALGGVPARDWPDACALGEGLDDVRAAGAQGLKVGSEKVAAWACRYEPEDGDGSSDVWTAWVARDAAEAALVLDPAGLRLTAGHRHPPIDGLGDEAYRLPKLIGATAITVRVGRYVVMVKSSTAGDTKRMAERVAKNLRRLG